jgi:hypothetical protein
MIGAGGTIPEAVVVLENRQSAPLAELAEDGPILLLFYLFDWSST